MSLLVFTGRALFSPRVDYNEWLPVGRADPLKNDPTFDYSPPILDRVHYWGDTNKDKKDILLLGVSSKRNFYTQPNANQVTPNDPQPSNRRNFYMSEVWIWCLQQLKWMALNLWAILSYKIVGVFKWTIFNIQTKVNFVNFRN